MLIWIIILEEYGPAIEHIWGKKNKTTYELSRYPINENKENTQELTYGKENMSEINDTKGLPEYNFRISLKLIDQYQQKYPSMMAKNETGTYKTSYFHG